MVNDLTRSEPSVCTLGKLQPLTFQPGFETRGECRLDGGCATGTAVAAHHTAMLRAEKRVGIT